MGESGYDVEVEIAQKGDFEILRENDREAVSISLTEVASLPEMSDDDLLVVFDLGTVLDIDDVRIAAPENGIRLEVRGLRKKRKSAAGPVRVPIVLKADNQVSLLLSRRNRPFGTLTVAIRHDGTLGDTAFLSDQEGI